MTAKKIVKAEGFESPEHIIMLMHMEMEGEVDQLTELGFNSGSLAFCMGLEIPSWLDQIPCYRKGFLDGFNWEKRLCETEKKLKRLSCQKMATRNEVPNS